MFDAPNKGHRVQMPTVSAHAGPRESRVIVSAVAEDCGNVVALLRRKVDRFVNSLFISKGSSGVGE